MRRKGELKVPPFFIFYGKKNLVRMKWYKCADFWMVLGETANAFSNVIDLRKVEIPEGVTDIESQAFKDCSLLQEVILPRSLGTIDDEAFYDCSSIYAIRYNGTIDEWTNITIGTDVFTEISITKIICIDGIIDI